MIRTKSAVILVHHEGHAKKHLESFSQSLDRQTLSKDHFDVYIVSNGCSEETNNFARSILPSAFHLQSNSNSGWGCANNIALEYARQRGYEYYIFLNIDIELDQNCLERLIMRAEQRQDEHIFQGKILLHGSNRINSIGNRVHVLGYGYCIGYGQDDSEQTRLPEVIDFASGACMLVKKEVFEMIGDFESTYFMYYDDLEFNWRARIAGYAIALQPESICWHKYDFSSKMDFIYHLEINRLMTVFTLMKKRTIFIILPALIVAQLLTGVYFVGRGKCRELIKVYKDIFSRDKINFIITKRGRIRKVRKLCDCSIVKKFSPTIVFAEIHDALGIKIANSLFKAYWKLAMFFIVC